MLTVGSTRQKLELAFQAFQGGAQKNYISKADLRKYLLSFSRIVRATIESLTSDVATIFGTAHSSSSEVGGGRCEWCSTAGRKDRGRFVARTLADSLDRTIETMVADAFKSARGGGGGGGGEYGLSLSDFQNWAERQPTLLSWYESLGDKWLTTIHKNGGIEWHRRQRQHGIRRALQEVDLRALLQDCKRRGGNGGGGGGGGWHDIRRADFRALLKSHTRLPSPELIEKLFD
eukprot:SAG22_NODE_948_length_6363_cov_1.935664_6_plen_231_part_01